MPLLEAGALAVEPDDVLAELRRAATALAATAELGSAAQRSAERLAATSLDLGDLLGPALQGDRAAIEAEARRTDLDPDALARLLDLALQPVLWEAASQLSALAEIDAWDRGYCPVCAAWPAIAELVGPEKRRMLRCVRCGTGWSWLVLLCPYCGNDDHRTLGSIQEAGSSQRIDVCERCHGYVKATPSYSPASAVRLVAEDVATLDLDLAATDRGYRRPGDVDVTVAGIPRLVREGRALPPERI
jgi:FdhE protein